MALKDHADPAAPKPPAEYFYAWWYAGVPTRSRPAAGLPGPLGARTPAGAPRTPEQIANWDAVTVVHGTSNTDAGAPDTGYTVEMRFNLTPMGYDMTKPEGDIVEWNISIYDCDWWWPLNNLNFAANRVWWQSPWGNAAWYDEVRIFTRPDVTVNTTGACRPSGPSCTSRTAPRIRLPPSTEISRRSGVGDAYTFDIQFGDDALRQTYPGRGARTAPGSTSRTSTAARPPWSTPPGDREGLLA